MTDFTREESWVQHMPDVSTDTKPLPVKIAEDLHSWMSELRSPNGAYVVDPHEFLPANVTCDFEGSTLFIKAMVIRIEAVMRKENIIPSVDKKDRSKAAPSPSGRA